MNAKNITLCALVASVYTVLSLLVAPFAFGAIQVRIGEALMVLCLIDKEYVYALTLGCFLTNLIGVITAVNPLVLDIFIGTSATFIAGLLVYQFRNILWFKQPILSMLMVVIINGILVGLELMYYFNLSISEGFITMIQVAIGELIACILGLLLFNSIKKIFVDRFV